MVYCSSASTIYAHFKKEWDRTISARNRYNLGWLLMIAHVRFYCFLLKISKIIIVFVFILVMDNLTCRNDLGGIFPPHHMMLISISFPVEFSWISFRGNNQYVWAISHTPLTMNSPGFAIWRGDGESNTDHRVGGPRQFPNYYRRKTGAHPRFCPSIFRSSNGCLNYHGQMGDWLQGLGSNQPTAQLMRLTWSPDLRCIMVPSPCVDQERSAV